MSGSTSNNYRIVVLGSGGVGKSALTLRLISDEFAEEYDPTIEDSYRKQVKIDGKPALLDVLDTAGQEEYASLQDQWIREGDGYLIVYSITNKHSLEEANVLWEKICRIRDENAGEFPLVLVGNKCDLETERDVPKADGQKKADKYQCPFFETSAKTKKNTETAFFAVVREIRAHAEKNTTKTTGGKKKFCTIL
jgi:GTPase KRas protein